MTLFGQFFDHGLDLITKGGGTVFVPLQPDDPLYVAGSPTNFMVLSRAVTTRALGPTASLGTADDDPWAHQHHHALHRPEPDLHLAPVAPGVPARIRRLVDGKPVATGHMLDGASYRRRQLGRRQGTGRRDAGHPADRHGRASTCRCWRPTATANSSAAPNGFVQLVTAHRPGGSAIRRPTAASGTPAARGRHPHRPCIPDRHRAQRGAGHRSTTRPAMPIDGSRRPAAAQPDYDPTKPIAGQSADCCAARWTYDNEMLDRHFVTGDGRGNENIGLTADALRCSTPSTTGWSTTTRKHHPRQRRPRHPQRMADDGLSPSASRPARSPRTIAALPWDGERLFQAGRFVTEMQYQHLVFEEFARARAARPSIPSSSTNSADIDPAIVEEFANVVYRFGHSMLTETVARLDATLADRRHRPDPGLPQPGRVQPRTAAPTERPTPIGSHHARHVAPGRQRDRRVRHRGAAQQPGGPAARPGRAQHRPRPRHRRAHASTRRARSSTTMTGDVAAQALHELGRLRAAPEEPGVDHQLHRRLRHARRPSPAPPRWPESAPPPTRWCSAGDWTTTATRAASRRRRPTASTS